MITMDVISRTFFINFDDGKGTAFAFDIENRQYLVTARHIIEGISKKPSIKILHGNEWKTIPVTIVGMGETEKTEDDVAVLATTFLLAHPQRTLDANPESVAFGQQVYFCGFPLGLYTDIGITNRYPVPMIKGALMSGILENPRKIYVLDGHNNRGFSGGPAVFRPKENPNLDFQILGVVSGYRTDEAEVTYQGKPTGLSSRENTGIILCPSIKQVTDIIAANPIGFEIPANLPPISK